MARKAGTKPAQATIARRRAVLVLGMHRSGTSSLSGTLVRLGVTPPNHLMPPSASNERGYYESQLIAQFDDEIILLFGSTWHDWRSLTHVWTQRENIHRFLGRAKDLLVAEYGNQTPIVVKDPRICRLLPFWLEVLEAADHDVTILICLRSPLEVARSLYRRDGIPLSSGLLLWLRHVLEAELGSRGVNRAFIHWPAFLADWRLALSRACTMAKFEMPASSQAQANDVDSYLSHHLRHEVSDERDLTDHPDVNDWLTTTYESLKLLCLDPSSTGAMRNLDGVKADFDTASAIFGGALVGLEKGLAHTASQLQEVTARLDQADAERQGTFREREKLLADVDRLREHEMHVTAINLELAQRCEEQSRAAEAHRLGLQQNLAELSEQLSAALETEQKLQGELSRTEAELAGLEHRVRQDLSAQMDLVQSERDQLLQQVQALSTSEARTAAQLSQMEHQAHEQQERLQQQIIDLMSSNQALLNQLRRAADRLATSMNSKQKFMDQLDVAVLYPQESEDVQP